MIFQVAVDYLPLAFGALVMCACMAFIVTTADSYLLSSATNLTNDIYVKYIRKELRTSRRCWCCGGPSWYSVSSRWP